jgi:hypothetical protein
MTTTPGKRHTAHSLLRAPTRASLVIELAIEVHPREMAYINAYYKRQRLGLNPEAQ